MLWRMLLKKILTNIKKIYFNHSFIVLVVVFISLLLINNIMYINAIHRIQLKVFQEFNTSEQKKDFQQALITKLKKIKLLNAQIYTIEDGENYWGIAVTHGIDINTIIGLNPYLKNLFSSINEHIIIGEQKGTLHFVQKNENIISIAKLYQIDPVSLRKINGVSFLKELFFPLNLGDLLFIPDGKLMLLTEEMKYLFELRKALQSPLGGKYTSGYGLRLDPFTKQKRYHNGLDIKVKIGDLVGAANAGVVISAGWANGYGKMIMIKHDNGYTTLYGHLSRIHVTSGQRVKKGQIIARAGNTGRTTGPHLHFTVWYQGKPVNPALFLW